MAITAKNSEKDALPVVPAPPTQPKGMRYGVKQREVTLAVGITKELNSRINKIVGELDVPSRSHWLRDELEKMCRKYEKRSDG
jgi:hypothetical protein